MANIITLDEAKNYLRVDSADDNTLISSLIITAEDLVEKFTGRILLTATFELVYDSAEEMIEIRKSPLQQGTKIEVIDEAGVRTEVSSSLYIVDISGLWGRIHLKSGCTWPTHRDFASFIITAKAGYGDTADKIPAVFKQAALIALAILYETRGVMDEGKIMAAISNLLWPYRIMGI